MRTVDHMILGRGLWEHYMGDAMSVNRKAFLIGCVEPDKNYATYLRGGKAHKSLRGHNAGNSEKHIKECLQDLSTDNEWGMWNYFVFGTVMHYVADAFTFPHNSGFVGTMREHVKYEHRLHYRMIPAVKELKTPNSPHFFHDGHESIIQLHSDYSKAPRSISRDSEYIIRSCHSLFNGAMNFIDKPKLKPALGI